MTCVHHYILDAPNGAKTGSGLVSNGTCKNCGDEKLHVNDYEKNTLKEIRTGKWRQVRNFIIGNGTTREK
tara:strand:- start:2067 stop:2276 length:210 start_codon:yes stop_codon:yes gene_type:complete